MDPYVHTAIALVLLASAYYVGRVTMVLQSRKHYVLGKLDGAQELLDILEDEGSHKRSDLIGAVARWYETQTQIEKEDDDEL